ALGGRHHPLRPQRGPLGAGGRARPPRIFGARAGGDVRTDPLPRDRRAAVSPDARAARLLLVPAARTGVIGEQDLIEFVTSQRWFGSKTRNVIAARIVDRAVLRDVEPRLEVALVEVGFETGTHETYQLLLGDDDLDALADPRHVRELVHMIRGGATVQAEEGIVEFRPTEGFAGLGTELLEARSIGTEQSNTSIVFDEELIL